MEVGFIRLTGRCDGPAPQFSPGDSKQGATRARRRGFHAFACSNSALSLLHFAFAVGGKFS